jgi:hypothetical protein
MTTSRSVRVDLPENSPASERVVEEVASLQEVPPTDLEPLYDSMDPAALDALLSCGAWTGEVRFEYHGYEIAVRRDAEVSVSINPA